MDTSEERKVPEEVLGVKLDEESKKLLLEGKETELISGFISQKTGKPFDAYLTLNENNQIRYRFPKREKSKRKTPLKIPSRIGGVELEPDDIEELKAGRETKLIMGIESKKKGRFYDAYLRWHPEKGILFRFPGQD